ncbi:hypothetical protein ILYODFUR_026392, partial [Ilyodon furcidens]
MNSAEVTLSLTFAHNPSSSSSMGASLELVHQRGHRFKSQVGGGAVSGRVLEGARGRGKGGRPPLTQFRTLPFSMLLFPLPPFLHLSCFLSHSGVLCTHVDVQDLHQCFRCILHMPLHNYVHSMCGMLCAS